MENSAESIAGSDIFYFGISDVLTGCHAVCYLLLVFMNVIIYNAWAKVLKLRLHPTWLKNYCLKTCIGPTNKTGNYRLTSVLALDNNGYIKHCSLEYNISPLLIRKHVLGNSKKYSKYFYSSNHGMCNLYVRYLSTDNHTKYSDINKKSWITLLPKQIQPYLILARVDRPIGYWLLFLPCSWSISLAAEAGSLPDLKLLTLFFVGSLLMRSAGCVINDLWDADLDKKVARTASRPLASGEISKYQGLVFLAGQLSGALGILLSLNNHSIALGASSLLLITTYPLMKRITFWPQLFLGTTMNWGCLLGWSAVNASLDFSVCLPLYFAGINWTLFYDTIYSFQDVRYDQNAGIKSTGLLFGDETKLYLSVFGFIMVANLFAVGIYSSQTWPYYLGLVGVTSHLTWQLSQLDLCQPKDCLAKFKSNKWLGVLLMLSIIASTLMKDENKEENEENS